MSLLGTFIQLGGYLLSAVVIAGLIWAGIHLSRRYRVWVTRKDDGDVRTRDEHRP